MIIQSINPANNQTILEYELHTNEQVLNKIKDTDRAWQLWKFSDFKERSNLMVAAAAVLRGRKAELAQLMALEMGKPLKAGRAEIEKCADVCEYYSKNAEAFLADEMVTSDASKSKVAYRPLGVILAVMPWNFPFWQVFRFLAPCLMAGNCGVLKHASNVPGCALAIEEIIRQAGFPENVFQTLLIESNQVENVITNPLIKAVTLTGSTAAGKAVAQAAGKYLKKTVLELGGSDAYIILEDADLDLAAETCVNSRLINSGQSCIAAKRFIVLKSVEEKFTELFRQKMALKIMGDPMDENTDIGPQARADLRDQLHEQVEKSIKQGAKCILGGSIPSGQHAYYPATILTGVKKGMIAYEEELFGPVASIITAEDEAEAVRIANDTVFGLGSAILSKDINKAEKMATEQIEAGSCFVNTMVKSDPRLPFGGIKNSGYGRELALFGIREFVNIKTVFIK